MSPTSVKLSVSDILIVADIQLTTIQDGHNA
jgi:hypothetical protein